MSDPAVPTSPSGKSSKRPHDHVPISPARALGAGWSVDELKTFFSEFKSHGLNFAQFNLPSRTAEMIQAMFECHKGFLNRPEATSDAFVEVAMDQERRAKQSVADYSIDNLEEQAAMALLSARNSQNAFTRTTETKRTRDQASSGDDWQNDDEDEDDVASQGKRLRLKQTQEELQLRSKRVMNYLSSGQCMKFCEYEWFYASIDHPWFHAEVSEFQTCLNDNNLGHIERATRTEWAYMRHKLGKPRRLSPAFLRSEREKLEDQRRKARLLHQGRVNASQDLSQWPLEVSAPLEVGQRVSARCPSSNVNYNNFTFLGTILSVEHLQSSYKIQFDRRELGVHVVADVDVMPVGSQHSVPISHFIHRIRATPNFSRGPLSSARRTPQQFAGFPDDLLLSGSPSFLNTEFFNFNGNLTAGTPTRKKLQMLLGNEPFPTDFEDLPVEQQIFIEPLSDCELLAKLELVLLTKTALLEQLQEFNEKAERTIAQDQLLEEEFKRNYAWLIVELDFTNSKLRPLLLDLEHRTRAPVAMTPVRNKLHVSSDQVCPEIVLEANEKARRIVQSACAKLASQRPSEGKSAADGAVSSALDVLSSSAVWASGTEQEEEEKKISLINSLVSLLLQIRECAARKLNDVDVRYVLNSALSGLKVHKENQAVVDELQLVLNSIISSVCLTGALRIN